MPRVLAASAAALRQFSLIEFSVCQGLDMVRLDSEDGGDGWGRLGWSSQRISDV